MAEQYINMDNLAVGYNGKALIHDICIGIEKGEIVTLIGPNGAGKSTILKSITRQLKIISGNVKIADADLSKLSFRDLSTKMAVVLTDRMKPELMTCHDIVATGRYPYTGKLGILSREDEQKVDEAMEAVHAQELGDRDFNAISDGQRQRVLLARAICQEPEIIVLDEPTSFLDVRYKLELLSILRNMAKKKGMKLIANNKKAFHDYFIEDTYEAGIALAGTEVKSLRMGKCSIKESFIRVENGEVYIYGMHISPYEKGNIFNKDPLRIRKLLLHRYEINKIEAKLKEKGLTLVPLKVYFKDSLVKVEIGMARGKKLYDKRQDIAKKDQRREAERDFKVKNLY